jgi:thymidylate synthase (FAD)
MAHMVVEINTTRAISAQILRHRSFSFQEFSQRYSPVPQTIYLPLQRMAGATNRQSSLDLPDELTESQEKAYNDANDAVVRAFDAYQCLLANGFATETARMVLPMSSSTRLYMAGNIRDWLHYVDVRTQEDTQAEHRIIANDIKLIIEEQLPTIHEAMWGKD